MGVAIGGTATGVETDALNSALVASGTVNLACGGVVGAADVMVTWAVGADGGTSVMCGRVGSETVVVSPATVGFIPCSSSFLFSSIAIRSRIRLTVCLESDKTESL
jgi:hypothetical protein